MKIHKHQSGGSIYTPVQSIYADNEGADQAPSTASSKNASKLEDTISKEIAEVLATRGIPVDVSVFLAKADSLLRKSNMFGFNTSDNNSYSKLIQLHQLANEIQWNKTLYDNAQSRVKEGLTGSDYALSDDGKFYVMDKDRKISTKSYEELVKNEGKYMLLTNNQLLQERTHSSGNQFNSNILRDVSNYVGMNEIMDDVRGIIKEIGTQKNQGYVNQIGGAAQRGFEYLNNIMNGEDGLYEFTTEGSKSMRDIQSALNYITNSLNHNAKNTLKANSKLNGIDPNQMILSAIFENSNETRIVKKVNEDDDKTGKKSGSGSSSSANENITYLQAVANGRQVKPRNIFIGSSKDKGGLKVSAQSYMILDDQEKSIPQNNMEQLLNQAQIGKIVDVNSISMGDQYIPYEHLNRIMWDKSNAHRMKLPVDQQAKYMGIIKPDLKAYERFQKFEAWVKDHPGVTMQQCYQKLSELNLPVDINTETGEWDFLPEYTELFLATSGYVNTSAIDIDTKSKFFDHVSSTDGEHIIKLYETITNMGTGAPTKNAIATDDVKLGTFGLRWLGADGSNKFYKAPIFMPIVDVALAFTADEKEYTSRENMTDVLQRREYQDEVRSIRSQF